ncbi:hypothetical protein BOTBODRAFT_609754 [Botryobasidium botryosum FD-172 SS1]|uniref:Uncharacterized protein n=1 Tax=Botryobasidium botryosum (strain FD-172 SS1) TaxID=930990 RepID=A0A067LVP5_BOTB1|nr:hypothetical protein BOTBODRAFT_609754 [Botryobasidium botryosum FD-172 SS1]
MKREAKKMSGKALETKRLAYCSLFRPNLSLSTAPPLRLRHPLPIISFPSIPFLFFNDHLGPLLVPRLPLLRHFLLLVLLNHSRRTAVRTQLRKLPAHPLQLPRRRARVLRLGHIRKALLADQAIPRGRKTLVPVDRALQVANSIPGACVSF